MTVGHEVLVIDDLKDFSTRCHTYWVAAVSGKCSLSIHAVVRNFLCGCNSRDRESIGNLFCHRHDIGLGTEPLKSPVMGTNTAKTSLNFIAEIEATGILDVFHCFVDIVFWHWYEATSALDWFSHIKSDLTGSVEIDNIFDVIGVPLSGSQLSMLITCVSWEWSSIKVWERAVLDTLSLRDIVVPGRYGR